MSNGRSQTATKYHEPLLRVIRSRPEQFTGVVKAERIRELYTEVTGDADEKRFFQPSDHCDGLENKEGVCTICKGGSHLLERIRHGYYRVPDQPITNDPSETASTQS
jgi:hypothetical protein